VEGELMSFQKLIDKQLDNAFKKIKDLAIDVVFTPKESEEFDFGTGEVSTVDGDPVTIQTVVIEVSEGLNHRKGEVQQLLFKSKDIDISAYSVVQINGINFRLVLPAVNQSEKITVVNAIREN